MGRKSKLKARRRRSQRKRSERLERRPADVWKEVQGMERLVATLVRKLRTHGKARGTELLRFLGILLYAWGEEIPLEELWDRPVVGLEGKKKLRDWTKAALVSLAGQSKSEDAQIRSDATWALQEIGVTKESLGLVHAGPTPGRAEDIIAEVEASVRRLDGIVAEIWESVASP